MTRDDILRMAREAGFEFKDRAEPRLERFAALVAAAERKGCIKIIETHQIPIGNSAAGELARDWTFSALKKIRDEIRARGEK